MKKIFALGWMLVAALALTNCSKEETVTPEMGGGQAFELFANTNSSRTTMTDLKTSWTDGDAMNVWTAAAEGYQSHGQFTVEDVENGKFKGTLDASFDATTANDWFVLYPYNSSIKLPDGSNYMYVGHTAPKQNGNNSQAHLSGSSAPLYGVATAVAGSETPVFQMHHLSTFVRVRVTNNTAKPFTVGSVYMTSESELYLAGSYYVNITGEEVDYLPSGGTYTKSEVTLTVNNGEEIAVGEQAEFYLPLAPIQFGEADEMLTIDIKTVEGATISVEKTIPAGTKFAAGVMNTLKVEATEDNTEYPEVETEWTTIAEIHAASAEGTYNIQNVTVVAKGYYNLLLKDATGYLFSYQTLDAEVGDIINIRNALTSTYGERQIKSDAVVEKIGVTEVTHPEATLLVNGAEFDAKSDNLTVGEYIQFEASSLTVSGNYTNLYVYGATRIGSAIRPATAFTSSTTPVLVTGYACYTYGQYLNIFVTEVVPVENYLYPASGSASIDANGTAKTIAVTTDNVNWTVEDDAEWLDAQNVDGVLTLTALQNTVTEAREAKVVLTHATADITRTVVVSQSAAPSTDVIYYQKVTSTPSDWSGTYLIVNEDESFVFNGSLTVLDAANNYKKVTITDSAIEATEEINGYAFTIAAVGDSGTIKSASGYYIGQTGDANGLKSSTTTSYSNKLTLNADGSVHIVSGNAYLRFNTTSGQDRFRYYKSSTFSNQKAIQLYKLSE